MQMRCNDANNVQCSSIIGAQPTLQLLPPRPFRVWLCGHFLCGFFKIINKYYTRNYLCTVPFCTRDKRGTLPRLLIYRDRIDTKFKSDLKRMSENEIYS